MEQAIEAWDDSAEVGGELRQVHGGVTRRDALLAALPPALFGLSISLPFLLMVLMGQLVIGRRTLLCYGPSISGTVVIGVGVALLTVLTLTIGGVVAAVLRRLPLWGYTWTGSAVMGILCILMIASDDLPYLVSPVIDMLIAIALLLLMGAAIGLACAGRCWADWLG